MVALQKNSPNDRMLEVLRRCQSTWMPTRMIALRIGMSHGTVSRVLVLLEQQALVTKRRALENDCGFKGFEWKVSETGKMGAKMVAA